MGIRDQVAISGNIVVCQAIRDAAIDAPIAVAGSGGRPSSVFALLLVLWLNVW